MACRFCARRRKASDIEVLRQDIQQGKSEGEVALATAGSHTRSSGLRDLSEEVLSSVFRCLRATEVLTSLEPCSKFLQSILGEPDSLWTAFLAQEFPGEGRSLQSCADKAPKWLYRQLIQRRLCDNVEWRQVPLPRSNLGAREGSPGVFYKHGYVFIFGGWGFGPMRDLHVAALQTPMHFQEVMVQGSGPAPTYEAKTTVLEDAKELDGDNSGVFRVIVTGGWRHGGYYEESGMYGIMEIDCRDGAVKARWVRTGSQMPRANHSATYVPPSIAGHLYPDGYLLVFGGCVNGTNSNAMSLLDFSNYHWTEIDMGASSPEPQNSHSATLVSCTVGSNGSKKLEYAILILGGGGGDASNGGPPRGGRDFVASEYWLCGLEGAQFRWEAHQSSVGPGGRGHVAVRLSGTDTVVMMGGGRPPLQRTCAVTTGISGITGNHARVLECKTKGPAARAFGGGCALPGGLAMVYGGWHPCKGTFSDVWVACFDDIGRNSAFFQQLPAPDVEAEEPEESGDEMAFNLVIRRLFRQMEGEGHEGMREGLRSGDEDSDSEEEEDENDESSEDMDGDGAEAPAPEDLQDLMDDLDSSAPLVKSSDEDSSPSSRRSGQDPRL